MIDPNGSAYPTSFQRLEKMGEGGRSRWVTLQETGLTIRAEIAARMMAAFAEEDGGSNTTLESYARCAVEWADALIAALNTTGGQQ